MKIAIIGAGSTYTPELMEGIIKRSGSLPVRELALMDIDARKLDIVGDLSARMAAAAGMDCRVVKTQELDEALSGADFVLGQIRVGKLPARVLDEQIPLKYGMIGQETCGIGGFFKAMRTIPVMLDIARRMETLCPDAWLINFSNPAGILTEAILNHSKIKMLGLCNVPYNMTKSIRSKMELPEARLTYVGLNHLSWITGIEQDGRDYLQDALAQGLNSETMKNIPSSGFSQELVQTIGAIPSSYLEYYYFKNKKLDLLKKAEQSRGQRCMEIEEELLGLYEDAKLHTKPELLASRGGANYSEVAISLVDAIWNDKQEEHVVNLLNQGALDFMEDTDAVEITAVIGKDGAKPIPVRGLDNAHIRDYMRMVKAYERETVEAAVSGSEEAAMRALLMNPLVGDYDAARACFDELKEAHRDYLPQFRS
ncbi:6-phospho-beta-glucosidase [Paenibacillus pasadenensis]|uniref:6-phospho-beta-glucosidase n=1 Tax=Paenibacillus pasadenensis TaxID=217090 RepID=A0A2N5N033_9BACL|nr:MULTISPECIES: 6-phospho-beta-glucosidase [Paenibacillus]PLT43686.1 6-phospho-beta-glucosidase [Paenibacillus pasadenensis]QGG54311.1 6-phospho-beta-glucosidase [Paenibacillus sp. B01]